MFSFRRRFIRRFIVSSLAYLVVVDEIEVLESGYDIFFLHTGYLTDFTGGTQKGQGISHA